VKAAAPSFPIVAQTRTLRSTLSRTLANVTSRTDHVHAGSHEVDIGLIATPVDTFTLYGYHTLRYGRTFGDPELDVPFTSILPEDPELPPSIAAVAHRPPEWPGRPPSKTRENFFRILTKLGPYRDAYTIGGNPIVPYVVAGSLTASISLNNQTIWDALSILMATATDAIVGDTEGTLVLGSTFPELFSRVLFSGPGVTPVPRMIVSKSRERFEQVVAAAQGLW
jgi:hypothetical protein